MIECLTNNQLSVLKNAELEILKETLQIIDKLNLRYFAVGGTALGAVKYGGFIPWDDDIDIAMPRPDYEIFKKEAKKYISNYFFIQCQETDSEFFLDMIKIRDIRTVYIENSTANFDITNGVFIDIFPIDGNGNKPFFRKSFLYKIRSAKIFQLFRSKIKPSFKGRLLNKLANILLFNKTLNHCYKKNSYIHSKKPLAESKYCYCRTQVIKSEYFFQSTIKSFEGIDLCVPKNFDAFLTDCFGDYKKDLPDEMKVSHHYCLACYISKK